jgi:hypothetical protein
MSDTTWRGVPLLESGDGILEGLALLANNLNVGIPVDSVAAARTLLTQAEVDGVAPTSSNPAMFLVGEGVKRILYISDGAKSSDVWVLSPINEVEYSEVAYTAGDLISHSGYGTYTRLITANLPTRAYDRVAIGWGTATGDVGAGKFNVVVRMNGIYDGQLARWDSADAQSSVSTLNLRKIHAGVDPDINLSVMSAGTGTNTVQMATSENSTKLIVLAFPITMA